VLPPNASPRSVHKPMPDEPTTPDLGELMRRGVDALNRRDLSEFLSGWAPDAVWDTGGMMGTFEGVAAIRGFLKDWFASYQELRVGLDEVLDLGNGVVFAVLIQKARLVGSSGDVRHRVALVGVWVDGLIESATNYTDIDEARTAAERLAQERG
jgi:ketosteroid isomerase-like protein